MNPVFKLALAGAFLASTLPLAHADASPRGAASVQAGNADTTSEMSEGEIKKIDKENGKLTIKHGELKNLGMPPMTMIFQVKDKSMLEQVKPGDKINFVAGKENGKLTVVQLKPVH